MDMNIKMPKGYTLLANYKNEVVLAEADNKDLPEPYVVWSVSNGSDTHTGSYFVDLKNAETKFCERAFNTNQNISILTYGGNKEDIKRAMNIIRQLNS